MSGDPPLSALIDGGEASGAGAGGEDDLEPRQTAAPAFVPDRPRPRSEPEAPPEEPPPPRSPIERAAAALREVRTVQGMLAAVLTWSITVAPAAFSRGAPASARVLAILALPCGVLAPLLVVPRRRLARHLGITAFLSLAVTSWLLAAPAIQPSRLDPIRAAIGAVAWGVFALSWRDRWPTGASLAPDPDAPLLQARSHLPPLAAGIAGAGAIASLVLLVLAWRVREADRALLAQAAAIACAIAVITAAAEVAVSRGRRPPSGGARRLTSYAVRPLLLLVAFAVAGALVMALR